MQSLCMSEGKILEGEREAKRKFCVSSFFAVVKRNVTLLRNDEMRYYHYYYYDDHDHHDDTYPVIFSCCNVGNFLLDFFYPIVQWCTLTTQYKNVRTISRMKNCFFMPSFDNLSTAWLALLIIITKLTIPCALSLRRKGDTGVKGDYYSENEEIYWCNVGKEAEDGSCALHEE